MRTRHSSLSVSPQKFDRIVVVINPQSSNIQRIETRAQELIRLFPNLTFETIETTAALARFRGTFLKKLQLDKRRTLLAIGGGDGTVNMVTNILLSAKKPRINLENIVLLPLWGGNANDLARMLNGLSSQTKLRSIINQGNAAAVHPFEIKMASPSAKPEVRYAVSYASFGAIAYTAKQLAAHEKQNSKSFHKHLLNEALRAARALLDAPGYEVEQASGEKIKIFEQLFSNGPRIAKLTGLPVKLNEKRFYFVSRSDKRPTALFYIVRLLAGKKLGQIRQEPVRFTISQRTWAQFDGEVAAIPENTTIIVKHSTRPLYMLSTKLSAQYSQSKKTTPKNKHRRRKVWLALLLAFVIFHAWLHITNPYASASIIQNPYTTYIEDGQIKVRKNYDMHVSSNFLAQWLGYYKSGFLIVQNNLVSSRHSTATQVSQVIGDIHDIRFDPSKPYLISGNQYSVLYPRNLGVFYNSILDSRTALSQTDWENRQSVYLQSAIYALDAFSSKNTLATTIVPISPRGVLLTEVHPGSVPSDSLYGILYAFRALSQPAQVAQSPYKIQTITTAEEIIQQRKNDLKQLVEVYISQVQDPSSEMVKRHTKLSSARDGVTRDSSFYDNVILWKTLSLANELSIKKYDAEYLNQLHAKIMNEYWDEQTGIFSDEFRDNNQRPAFSADWLIAMPAGFLDVNLQSDRAKLVRIVDYSEKQGITNPLPIKYTLANTSKHTPLAVRWFVPNYGGDAIWSYWGSEYITLLDNLNPVTGDPRYHSQAENALKAYDERIVRYGGFPETYNPNGTFLRTAFYKSILETGWIVQYEKARCEYDENLCLGLASSANSANF